MGQALYRKYRSKSLSEIVGQEHVTATLASALNQGRISHAYLLTGPRGVGKTSIARILAHEINQLPYDDEAHLDIIEIDAASNRRIDEIRDLRDRVSTAPAAAKYKVYIIDEVHMLTKEAFNALLKTLEEPPAHVVFILATTEAHKLPETIVSRTQRYSFRPASSQSIVNLLNDIAKKENIHIDQAAVEFIAQHADGSFRDSVSLLDQARSTSENITKKDVEQMLGLAPAELIAALHEAVTHADGSRIVATLATLHGHGYEPATVAVQLSDLLRSAVLAGTTSDAPATLRLLQALLDIPAARNPGQLLELVLLQTALGAMAPAPVPVVTVATKVPAAVSPAVSPPAFQPAAASQDQAQPPVTNAGDVPESNTLPHAGEKPAAATTQAVPAASPVLDADADVLELWQRTLDEIKKQYNTLYGIARMATPELAGNTLTLHLKFAFHQKRLNEVKNRKIFSDTIERLSGRQIDIVCVVADKPTTAAAVAPADVSTISNIFGGAELLES